MSQNHSIFAVPCYYTGTSFERIYAAITHVIQLNDLPIDVIVGPRIDNALREGALDDTQYTQSQAEMMVNLLKMISTKKYDRILFIDFFNPGMELVRYFAEQSEHEIKMAALLHGGTFIEGDIYEADWVTRSEQLWGSLFDRVFVPSRYAQSQLPDYLANKTSVYPWGMDNIISEGFAKPYNERSIDVIFPHRLSSDKGVGDLANIARQLPDVSFVITSPNSTAEALPYELSRLDNITQTNCASTNELHATMGDAKMVLSCAKQELFGYAVAEAVSLGCQPVLPRNQVYTELYSDNVLYSDLIKAVALIRERLSPDYEAASDSINTSFLPLLKEFLEIR